MTRTSLAIVDPQEGPSRPTQNHRTHGPGPSTHDMHGPASHAAHDAHDTCRWFTTALFVRSIIAVRVDHNCFWHVSHDPDDQAWIEQARGDVAHEGWVIYMLVRDRDGLRWSIVVIALL